MLCFLLQRKIYQLSQATIADQIHAVDSLSLDHAPLGRSTVLYSSCGMTWSFYPQQVSKHDVYV